MDFGKLRRAHGYQTGWLMSKLLDGDRPVSVTARIRSAGGRATVDLQRVEISGVAIDGRTLDFLIENILLPLYPDAVVGRPFELGHRIERLEVGPPPWAWSSGGKRTGSDERIAHRHASYRCPSAKSSLQKTPQPNSTALLTTSASTRTSCSGAGNARLAADPHDRDGE